MKIRLLVVLSLPLVYSADLASASDHKVAPVPMIFDTDIGNDCDDVLALGVIHALQSRGECELLAVTITKDHKLAAAFTDVVNTFYGRGEIPIGVCRSGVTPAQGKFNGLADQSDRYPHDLKTGDDAPDAVNVLRTALAGAADKTVVIAQVGFSTNLANLLKSSPDTISPLNGVELVRKKVRLLSIMAGAFRQIEDSKGKLHDHREYNVVKDIPAAKHLVNHWPAPIVWSGYEVGLNLRYPHESILHDFEYVQHHPLADAYFVYSPPPHNRPTWDLTSVLHAVRPDHGYFGISESGTVTVHDDGLTTFTTAKNGRDRYLTISGAQKGRTTEALVQLASQPPASAAP